MRGSCPRDARLSARRDGLQVRARHQKKRRVWPRGHTLRSGSISEQTGDYTLFGPFGLLTAGWPSSSVPAQRDSLAPASDRALTIEEHRWFTVLRVMRWRVADARAFAAVPTLVLSCGERQRGVRRSEVSRSPWPGVDGWNVYRLLSARALSDESSPRSQTSRPSCCSRHRTSSPGTCRWSPA